MDRPKSDVVSVLLVDWLGRGGIAQLTETWVLELQSLGQECIVVTRGGRELDALPCDVVTVLVSGRIPAHRAVVHAASREIRRRRPAAVVLQNYLMPPLEHEVFEAAHRGNAKLVSIVHDHKLHTLRAGTRIGLRRNLRLADYVLAHSDYVGDRLRDYIGGAVDVVPIPKYIGVMQRAAQSQPLVEQATDQRTACHFGVMTRRYKGTDLVGELSTRDFERWRFVIAGVGAPALPNAASFPNFVDSGALAATLEKSDAAVLPYRFATQSGAVALAQTMGCPPVASAVGGIPEQIADDESGVLVPAGAPVDAWVEALRRLEDPQTLDRLRAGARGAMDVRHEAFIRFLRDHVV
jgi:glycosyltransferase involved in cell wall biosynthesis